jgi:hypothetical protein
MIGHVTGYTFNSNLIQPASLDQALNCLSSSETDGRWDFTPALVSRLNIPLYNHHQNEGWSHKKDVPWIVKEHSCISSELIVLVYLLFPRSWILILYYG